MAFRQKIILISRIFPRKLLSESQSNSLADLSGLMTCAVFPANPGTKRQEKGWVTPRWSPQEAQRKLMKYEGSYTQFMYTGCSSDFLLDHLLAELSL